METIRRFSPLVVVSHDFDGEYGHGAHKVCADAMRKCIERAADPRIEAKQVREYGAWQVKKLYLHLWPENVVDMDWRVPLEAFGGRTAFEMAEAGFQCHTSQLGTEYVVESTAFFASLAEKSCDHFLIGEAHGMEHAQPVDSVCGHQNILADNV